MNKFFIIILALFISACGQTMVAQAKPSGSVDIQYITPKNINMGDDAKASIHFIAKTDIEYLTINISAYKGLTLLSGDEEITVSSLDKGDVHSVEVTIHLIDSIGYLAVTAITTDSSGKQQHKNLAIRFGHQVNNEKPRRDTDKNSERFILMPAKENK